MDKFLVRSFAILANLYVPIVLFYAMQGVDISIYDYFFSNTFLFGILLIVLVHSQGRYHCLWMRGLCYNSAAIPLFCFTDAKYNLFNDAYYYIITISCIWSFGIAITIFLAVKHFRRATKVLNKRKYGNR